jgi:thioredoxin-like negative regulator of GroEL
MIELSDKTFKPTLKVTSPMIVMFHAKWAGPCNLVMPSYQEVADKRGNQIVFCTFDLEDNPGVPAFYNVKALPMFISFVDGEPVGMKAGAISIDLIEEMCDEL